MWCCLLADWHARTLCMNKKKKRSAHLCTNPASLSSPLSQRPSLTEGEGHGLGLVCGWFLNCSTDRMGWIKRKKYAGTQSSRITISLQCLHSFDYCHCLLCTNTLLLSLPWPTHTRSAFPNRLVDRPSRLLSSNWTCDPKRKMKAKQQWALTNPLLPFFFSFFSWSTLIRLNGPASWTRAMMFFRMGRCFCCSCPFLILLYFWIQIATIGLGVSNQTKYTVKITRRTGCEALALDEDRWYLSTGHTCAWVWTGNPIIASSFLSLSLSLTHLPQQGGFS